jgi:hypothetical protein
MSKLNEKIICFVLAGELNDCFLSQIAMFNLAVNKSNSLPTNIQIKAYLGTDDNCTIPVRWRKHLEGVEIVYIQKQFYPDIYIPQAMFRFVGDYTGVDYVILCDADTLILGSIDHVIQQLYYGYPVSGVIAHYPPSCFEDSNKDWQSISKKLTNKSITLPYNYTLMNSNELAIKNHPKSPFYLNHGFLAFQSDALKEFSTQYVKMRKLVCEIINPPFFAGQIALTLTVNDLGWQGDTLSMKYNFPNDEKALKLHAYESQDIRVLHYLRENNINRCSLFSEQIAFNSFISKIPPYSDEILHIAIMKLTKGIYPFN